MCLRPSCFWLLNSQSTLPCAIRGQTDHELRMINRKSYFNSPPKMPSLKSAFHRTNPRTNCDSAEDRPPAWREGVLLGFNWCGKKSWLTAHGPGGPCHKKKLAFQGLDL